MKRPALLDYATIITAVLQAAYAAHVWMFGPEGPIPMHFDASGQPDRWGDRSEAALVLGGLALLNLVLSGGMGLAAARTDDEARARALRVSQLITVITCLGVTILIGAVSVGGLGVKDTGQWQMAGVSLLFASIGAFLGRVGPNPFVGVRTPWTYKSRLAWDRSNRLAGRLFFLVGLAGLAASAFAPQPLGLMALIGAVLISALFAVVESWRIWRADPERTPF